MKSPHVAKVILLCLAIPLLLFVISACSEQDQSTSVVVPDISANLSDSHQPKVDVNQVVNDSHKDNRLVATALGDNLLINPKFENTSGWTSCGGATGYSLTDDSISGKAGKLSTGCFYQTVDATADTQLSLSCQAKVVTATGWSGIGFGFLDSSFTVLKQAPVQTISGGSFREYITTLTAPANTKYASIWVYTDGTVHIDDCTLSLGAPSAPQGNLLSNASFTSNADWFNCGDASNWNIASGDLNLTGTACLYQTNNAQANLQYNLSCTSKHATGVYTSFILSALDENYQSIGEKIAVIDNTSFQAKQVSLTTPTNAKYVAVSFYGEGATTHQECSLTAGSDSTNTVSQQGRWSEVQQWPLIATHMANLKDGRVLAWALGSAGTTKTTIFDPVTGTFEDADNPDHDMYCAGLVTLSDGSILAAGGGGGSDREKISIFNGTTWQKSTNDMANGHWYGTAVVDASDNVLVSLGNSANGKTSLISNDGTSKNMPGVNLAGTDEAGLYAPHWYPSLHLSPRGTIFHAGPTTQMHDISIAGNGTTIAKGSRNQDGVTGEDYRQWANGIMIDEGKILLTGGTPKENNPGSLATNVIIDINGTDPVVSKIAPMRYSRTFQSTILLPNGEVMVVGGNGIGKGFSDEQSRLIPEIYNSTTDTWRDVAALSVPRNYHSTAILLQDGRVLAAGGGLCNCDVNHQDGQIYSPPYLFNDDGSLADRPVIAATPNSISYNQDFNVSITGASANDITRFSMIRFSASTHHINTDLRQDALSFTNQGNGSYTLKSHSNKNVVTPGYYYLFALNSAGVPSVAKIIQIGTSTGSVQWQQSNSASRLKQVSAVDANQAWGVNASNHIYRTSDNGTTWQGTSGALKHVSGIDANHAWGVNSANRVYRTSNRGVNWQQPNPAITLSQVSAVDINHAWGVNTLGEIYHTSDGGTTWLRAHGALKYVSAIDAQHAWGVNSANQVYRTSNSGTNWLQPNPAMKLKQVSAVDINRAWGVNASDQVYHTSDGGLTWQRVSGEFKHVSAIDINQAWGVNSGDQVYNRAY